MKGSLRKLLPTWIKRSPDNNAKTEYTYDGRGRMLTSTDPNLHTTHYSYNATSQSLHQLPTRPGGRQRSATTRIGS